MKLLPRSSTTVNLGIVSRLSHLEVVIPVPVQIDIVFTVMEREDVLLDSRSQLFCIHICCGCKRALRVCEHVAAKSTLLLLFLHQIFECRSFR